MKHCGNEACKARIICPYFQRFTGDGRMIVCEGIIERAETCTAFRHRAELEQHLRLYCNTYGYGDCPVARTIAHRLED